jgi:hypothetical protein
MEKKMHKFPSIEQFRNVIQNVQHQARYDGDDKDGNPIYVDRELPTLNYRGSVKLHGSNGGIVFTWNPLTFNYDFHAQSRKNIITPEKDNAGFAAFVHTRNLEDILSKIMKAAGHLGYTPEVVRVYGEWCGGNIQKGVAINGLEKMFVIFAIRIDNMWFTDEQLNQIKNEEENIYNILDYPTYEISIDFNNPQEAAKKMSDLVEEVEKECPVGKAFGNSGVGEGIVFVCTDERWLGSKYWFKAKGEKHQSSKTKEKVPVDIERVNSINELVDSFLTESRLYQGLEQLRMDNLDLSRKNVGTFLKWIYNDIVKEELDTIMGNGFEPKELSGTISNKARNWFFEMENKGVGLN